MSKAATSIFNGLSRPPRRKLFKCKLTICRSLSSQSQQYHASSATDLSQPKPFTEPPVKKPRWAATPSRYTAPYRSKPPVPDNEFIVNENPDVLDRAYERLLGKGGHDLIREEVKWLAVTHKSFDHGKRGYNERLAVLGKTILDLQLSLVLAQAPPKRTTTQVSEDLDRAPFNHPAIDGIENLTWTRREKLLRRDTLSEVAEHYGLPEVIRWKPKRANKIAASGAARVYAETVYAIVGALALEQGGPFADNFARERVLSLL